MNNIHVFEDTGGNAFWFDPAAVNAVSLERTAQSAEIVIFLQMGEKLRLYVSTHTSQLLLMCLRGSHSHEQPQPTSFEIIESGMGASTTTLAVNASRLAAAQETRVADGTSRLALYFTDGTRESFRVPHTKRAMHALQNTSRRPVTPIADF